MTKNYLSENKKFTLLFFYPKDNTSGCTIENQDFTRLKNDFENLDIEIIGISRDSDATHEKFCQKYELTNRLIADENEEIHEKFGVIGDKNNYGKIVRGVFRSSFLLDSKTGETIKEWRNVRAK